MDQIQTSASSNVVSLPTKKESLTLKQILKEVPEIRGFYRYIDRYDLRVQALELIERKLYLSN